MPESEEDDPFPEETPTRPSAPQSLRPSTIRPPRTWSPMSTEAVRAELATMTPDKLSTPPLASPWWKRALRWLGLA